MASSINGKAIYLWLHGCAVTILLNTSLPLVRMTNHYYGFSEVLNSPKSTCMSTLVVELGLHKMSYPESSGVYLVTQSLRSLGPISPLAHTRTKTLASKIDPQQYIDHCCLADRARSWVLRILFPHIKLTWIYYREMSEMTQNKFWSVFALKAMPDSEPVHSWSGWCLGVSFLAMSGMMSRK